jgi:hypothetical protein
MTADRFPRAPGASRTRVIHRFPGSAMSSVEKRLASAERELRVQFTRIAQLQAELDLLLGAFRRLPRLQFKADRPNARGAVRGVSALFGTGGDGAATKPAR